MNSNYHINRVFLNQGLFSTYTPILVYHQINPDDTPDTSSDSKLTISQFESQMRFLYDHRFLCLNLTDLIQSSETKALPRKKGFVLTFDDGFEDFYTYAYPILQRYGFTATVFLITDFIKCCGNNAEMEGPGMTWEQIKALREKGISFGSHTCSHARLTDLSEEQLRHELMASKECITAGLGQKVLFLAYPYGDSNPTVQTMTMQAGYQAAFGVITVKPCRYNLWRTELKTKDSMWGFIFKLTRFYSYYIKLRGWVRERTAIGRYIRTVKHRRRPVSKV